MKVVSSKAPESTLNVSLLRTMFCELEQMAYKDGQAWEEVSFYEGCRYSYGLKGPLIPMR